MILKKYFGLPCRIQKKKTNNHRIQVYLYKLAMLCIWLTQSNFSLVYILVGCKNYKEKLHLKKKICQKKLCNFFKYLWYNLNIAGQYLACNVFHTSYNPGAGFVFFLSHPQHMVIDQHYIAGNFNKSIPNLEQKIKQTPQNGIEWKTHK